MWIIYASEISVCVGENRYKKRWEGFLSVFSRIDNGVKYEKAMKRLNKLGVEVQTEKEITQAVICQDPCMSVCVKEFLDSSVTNSVHLDQVITGFEETLTKREIELKEDKIKAKNIIGQVSEELTAVDREIGDLNKKLDPIRNELSIYELMNEFVTDKNEDWKVLRQKEKNLEKQIDEKIQKSEELMKKQESEKEFLINHEKKLNDFKTAKKNIIGEKQQTFGKNKEKELIEKNILPNISENNSEFYSICLGEIKHIDNNNKSISVRKWGVGGRIDGFRNGTLIEIKNRKSRIYDPLPSYDIIQTQSYMQILNVNEATVIQCLTLEDNEIEKKEINLQRDNTYWNDFIVKELTVFVHALNDFVNDSLLQDQFFQTIDNKKSYLMTSLLNKTKKKYNLTGGIIEELPKAKTVKTLHSINSRKSQSHSVFLPFDSSSDSLTIIPLSTSSSTSKRKSLS